VGSWAAKACGLAAVDDGPGTGKDLSWRGSELRAVRRLRHARSRWLLLRLDSREQDHRDRDARRRRLLVHETKAKGGCSVAILTGIGSSRTRVIQLTFGCKAGVTGFRLRHPVLTGICSPTPAAAVEARGTSPDALPRDLRPQPGVRVAAANCAHRFMRAAQLPGQAAAAQLRQQDQEHLIRAQRAALPLLGWRLAALALPDSPPMLTAVAPIPAATATISI